MSHATEKRQQNINEIVARAKADDQRVLEVNFINAIEAENARNDVHAREADREQRVSAIAEERARSARDKASKEAAAEERRRQVEQASAGERRRQVQLLAWS